MGDHLSSNVCDKAALVAAQLANKKIHAAVVRDQFIEPIPEPMPLMS
jgi:hypothetical protein